MAGVLPSNDLFATTGLKPQHERISDANECAAKRKQTVITWQSVQAAQEGTWDVYKTPVVFG